MNKTLEIFRVLFEWAVPGLNRGPSDFQSLALPAELTALRSAFYKRRERSRQPEREPISVRFQSGPAPAAGLKILAIRTIVPAARQRNEAVRIAETVPG